MNNEIVQLNSLEVEFITKNGVKINGLNNIDYNNSIHYLIYKITNTINGMYYIGQHQTKNPCDDYMGSGLLLENAKKKYGIDKFVKTILFDFSTREKMLEKEIELVQEKDCYHNNPQCYNLASGGQGGNLGEEVCKRISESISGEKNGMYGKKLSEESLKKISDKLKGHPNYTHKGWHQSEDAKRRISEKHIEKKLSSSSIEKIKFARANQKNLKLDGMKGKGWYHNPFTDKEAVFFEKGVPENSEWIRGRKPQNTKGKVYCTNGINDMLVDSIQDIPAGYHRGRKTKSIYSDARNKKISDKLKGRQVSDEVRQKLQKAVQGKHWFNNGVENTQAFVCPNGWTKGRLKRIRK